MILISFEVEIKISLILEANAMENSLVNVVIGKVPRSVDDLTAYPILVSPTLS